MQTRREAADAEKLVMRALRAVNRTNGVRVFRLHCLEVLLDASARKRAKVRHSGEEWRNFDDRAEKCLPRRADMMAPCSRRRWHKGCPISCVWLVRCNARFTQLAKNNSQQSAATTNARRPENWQLGGVGAEARPRSFPQRLLALPHFL